MKSTKRLMKSEREVEEICRKQVEENTSRRNTKRLRRTQHIRHLQ